MRRIHFLSWQPNAPLLNPMQSRRRESVENEIRNPSINVVVIYSVNNCKVVLSTDRPSQRFYSTFITSSDVFCLTSNPSSKLVNSVSEVALEPERSPRHRNSLPVARKVREVLQLSPSSTFTSFFFNFFDFHPPRFKKWLQKASLFRRRIQ